MADEVVPATEETSAPTVTDEMLKNLDEHPEKIRALDPATRAAVMERLTSGEEEEEAEPGKTETVEDEKPEDKPVDKTDKAEDAPAKEDVKPVRDRIKEDSDLANKLEQKAEAARKRRERAEEAYKKELEAAPAIPDDPLEDESHLKGALTDGRETKARLARLEAYMNDGAAAEESDTQQALAKTKELAVFSEFEDLQERFPDLKTVTPIAKINAQYTLALDATVETAGLKAAFPQASTEELRQKAIAWYNDADEATRATVKIPFPAEMEKLGLVLELWHKKANEGGTLRGHYLQKLDDEGILHETVQKGRQGAAKEAVRETVDALQRKDKDLKTIGSPGTGSTDGPAKSTDLTLESAYATLKRLNPRTGNWTPAERAEHKAAMAFITAKQAE